MDLKEKPSLTSKITKRFNRFCDLGYQISKIDVLVNSSFVHFIIDISYLDESDFENFITIKTILKARSFELYALGLKKFHVVFGIDNSNYEK